MNFDILRLWNSYLEYGKYERRGHITNLSWNYKLEFIIKNK